ncbi:Outer membrane protein assembly factor BamD [Azospirillaceae bacterium]
MGRIREVCRKMNNRLTCLKSHRIAGRAWSLLVVASTLIAVGFMTACSSTEDLPYVERPVEQIYNEAAAAMEAKEFKKATKLFEEVERQHPYSQWAVKAQLMAAYAYYQDMKYDDAVLALDRFIQLHPGNDQIAYAYYMRSLCYYEQISDVRRDQKMTKMALDSLKEIMRRFGDTEYARDAKLKYDLTMDHMAGKEMEVGRFYLRQRNHNAAIGRFRAVVDTYQTTSHVPEALHRLVECYLAVGIIPEAERTAAILGHNYPGSEWYQDSYALLVDANLAAPGAHNSWLARAWGSMF